MLKDFLKIHRVSYPTTIKIQICHKRVTCSRDETSEMTFVGLDDKKQMRLMKICLVIQMLAAKSWG